MGGDRSLAKGGEFLLSAGAFGEDPDARVGRRKRARLKNAEHEKELPAEKHPRTQHRWLEDERKRTKLPTPGGLEETRNDKTSDASSKAAVKGDPAGDGTLGKKKAKRLAVLQAKKAQKAERKTAAEARAVNAAAKAVKGKAQGKKELSKAAADLLRRCRRDPTGEQRLLAIAAERIAANPEKDLDLFDVCFELHRHGSDVQTRHLALLSAVALFKDLVPGYRIREPSEQEKVSQRSMQVLALEKQELGLLHLYKELLPTLENAMKQHPVAFAPALAALVKTASEFNYRQRLLGTAVKYANSEHASVRKVVAEGLGEMVEVDQRLEACREVVLAVGRTAQGAAAAAGGDRRGLRQEIFAVLLRIPIGRAEAVKLRGDHNSDLAGADDEMRRDLAEASISHGVEHLQKAEAELLYEVFVVYLRILRQRHLHERGLLAAVLSGLARWGQQVNLELLLEILAELRFTVQDAITKSDELVALQGLLCALVLLSGDSKALVTDATWLADAMTKALMLAVPSLHSAHSESAAWPPPRSFFVSGERYFHASHRELSAALDMDSVPALILRCLEAALRCPQGYGKASDGSLAVLIEHLFLLAAAADAHVGMALLREAALLLRRHHRLYTLLELEGGVFGLGGVVDRSVSVVWHLQALTCSIVPDVAKASGALPTAIPRRRVLLADLFPTRNAQIWLASEFMRHIAALGHAPAPRKPGRCKTTHQAVPFLSEAQLKAACAG